MPKALCISGIVISVLLLIVFILDLAVKFPFGGTSTMMDVSFIICAVVLGYLSWTTFREQVYEGGRDELASPTAVVPTLHG